MRWISATVLVAGALLAGCNHASPEVQQDARKAEAASKEAASKAGAELQKAGEKVSEEAKKVDAAAKPAAEDLALTAKVKAKLAAAPKVSALDIHVDTHDRVVTLSGTVDSAAAKDIAEGLARHTSGVKEVLDQLQVGAATPGATPSASPVS